MACEHSEVVASLASAYGATFLDPSFPRPSQPVHVLQISGTADSLVVYSGGVGPGDPAFTPGALRTVQTWADFNGCTDPVWDPAPCYDLDLIVPGLDTTVLRYASHPVGGAVELWTIDGGKHGGSVPLADPNAEFTPRIIDWLLAHRKP